MLVYRWKEHDMTVTFADRIDLHPEVELTLGREVRTLPLQEFTDFLLTIIKKGRKSITAYLKSLEEFPQEKALRKVGSTFECEI